MDNSSPIKVPHPSTPIQFDDYPTSYHAGFEEGYLDSTKATHFISTEIELAYLTGFNDGWDVRRKERNI